MSRTLALPRIYPIVDVVSEEAAEIERAFTLATEVARAGAGLLQLRAKSIGSGVLAEISTRWTGALAEFDCALVVNDRTDVALAAGAAGVHLGDCDLPPEAARRIAGDRLMIGYSTHSVEEAAAADPTIVDYIGFGPVFESPTKPGVREARGLALLEAACAAARVPVVAIGGITLETAPAVWAAGAHSLAIISELQKMGMSPFSKLLAA